MNNEIKEILEYVLSLTYGNENANKGIDKVKDYITNLQEQVYEQKELINTVIDDMKHFHLIYNEDGKLILSGESILAEIRYFIDKLEGSIPITMTPFEHEIWERENKENVKD